MYAIFIADDHVIIRDGLRRIIEENSDYKVVGEAGDGLHILPAMQKLRPDMLILDISMPHLRGIEAISKIRKFDKKVKILVLTMHKNEDYVYECLVNGAQGYILKEDADSELINAIRSLKENKIYISSSFTSEVIKNLLQRKRGMHNEKANTDFRQLTTREQEILKLIVEGNSNRETAEKLGISVRTVEHHRLNIMRKLSMQNIANLVRYAVKNKLVE